MTIIHGKPVEYGLQIFSAAFVLSPNPASHVHWIIFIFSILVAIST